MPTRFVESEDCCDVGGDGDDVPSAVVSFCCATEEANNDDSLEFVDTTLDVVYDVGGEKAVVVVMVQS